ncbi:MAG: sulfurtransferase complex subunit TusB [bacterium]|nr:sulfurtransferase complex subunit TusB [bacterium]
MSKLFMIIHSPYERKEVETLCSLVKSGDGILFIKNGVFINKYPNFPGNLDISNIKVFGLKEDIDARGVKDWKYDLVDYEGFAGLISEYDKVIS